MDDEAREPAEAESHREFRFKPAEFERANPSTTDAQGAPIDVRDLFKQAAANPPTKPAAQPENEVHAMLRDNLARDNAAGLNEILLESRPMSRRNRDYWTLLIGGDLCFCLLAAFLHSSTVLLMFCGAGIVFYSIALTWIMRFVMSDY